MDNPLVPYRSKLLEDLRDWNAKGWISDDGMDLIVREVNARQGGITFSHVAGLLGAVVMCFAAITFVAANWDDMDRWLRLGVLFTGMWGVYGAAGCLIRKGHDLFGQAAVLAGCGMFGANIMLIAQTYHIEGHPPDAILLWAAGTLLAAGLLRSAAAGALAYGLLTVWSCWETSLQGRFLFDFHGNLFVHWQFLPAWLAITALAVWQRWRLGAHMAGLSLVIWVVVALWYDLADWLVLPVGLMVACVALFQSRTHNRPNLLHRLRLPWQTVFVYASMIGMAAFAVRQVQVDPPVTFVFAAAGLGAGLAVIVSGRWLRSLAASLVGYAFFAGEMIYLYAETLGSLMGTAAFFAVAGASLIAIAVLALRLERNAHKPGMNQ